jgi:hypothetical protein
MALLPAESFDLADGHSLDANLCECFLHIFHFEGLDDCFDFFHLAAKQAEAILGCKSQEKLAHKTT